MKRETNDKKHGKTSFWITLGILGVVLIITVMVFWDSSKIEIDSTMPEFPTGIYLSEGRYQINFYNGWNLNRHVPHHKSTVQTLIGPKGIKWPESDTRPWAFPQLSSMSTALKIGDIVIPAEAEMIVDVNEKWLKGNEKLQLIVLINDIAGTHYDNGPGIWFTKYLPVWRKKPYQLEVVRIEM